MGGNKGKYYQGNYEGNYSWDIRMGFKIGRKDCGVASEKDYRTIKFL